MAPTKDTPASAWDDDWESIADRQEDREQKSEPAPEPRLSKAERRAQHAELNRQIWQSAENPEPMPFLETRNTVPLQSSFKPGVKVLARKPPTKVLPRNGGAGGMADMKVEDDDDDDSEEERRKKNEADFAERKARAEKERAEKERKYNEAREKIFGSPVASGESRGSSPNKPTRGKGRGRGGRDNQQRSSNEQSPVRPSPSGRQLYDPSYSPKPDSIYVNKKESGTSRPGTPNNQEKSHIREPRGPQRGAKGFAPRGKHSGNFAS